MSDRQTMDTNVTAESPKPQGSTVSNGTPGKAQGYMPSNQPFESVGIDSGDEGRVSWPQDQMKGFVPGSGKSQNDPNA